MTTIQIDFATDEMSIQEISQRANESYSRIYRYIKTNKLPYRDGRAAGRGGFPAKLSEDEQIRVCELYQEGRSITYIAKLFPAINRITVFNVLRRHNIPTRLRNGNDKLLPPKVSAEELNYWYWGQNCSLSDLVKRFGYSCSAAVVRDFKLYGIPRRSYKDAGKAKYQNDPEFKQRVLVGFEKSREAWSSGKKTWIESWCAEWLEQHNLPYVYQYQIPQTTSTLRHYFDFYIPSLHLLIEMDGVYWHQDEQQIQNDKFFDATAKKAGYNIMRISDAELKLKGMGAFDERLGKYVAERIENVCGDITTTNDIASS